MTDGTDEFDVTLRAMERRRARRLLSAPATGHQCSPSQGTLLPHAAGVSGSVRATHGSWAEVRGLIFLGRAA